jgi:hypothetical protein
MYLFLERRRASCSDEETVTISPHECSVEVRQFLIPPLSLPLSLSLCFSPFLYDLLDTHTLSHMRTMILSMHITTLGATAFCLCVFHVFSHSLVYIVVANLSRSIAFPLVLTLYTHTHTYTSCVSTSDEGVYTQMAIATLLAYII